MSLNQVSNTIKLKKYFNDILMSIDNFFLISRYTGLASVGFLFFFIYAFGDNIALNAEIGTNTWNALKGTLSFKDVSFITTDGTYTISGLRALSILTEDILNIAVNSIIFSILFFIGSTGGTYIFLIKRATAKGKDLHADKIKRGAKILENEEYIEYLKENKPEELSNEGEDYIELSTVYKVEEFKDKKKIETLYTKALKEASIDPKIILKSPNFISEAKLSDERFFKFTEEGKIKIHYKDSFQHMAISGSSGSGKSVFVTNYISGLLKRFNHYNSDPVKRSKKKMVILDLGEEFTTKFYNEKEWVKINPFSSDGYYINDFDYIENELQIISMSEIRIPDEKDGKDNSYFTSIRRAYLTAGYAYCILKDRKTTKDLYNLLTLERKELVEELTDAENKSRGLISVIRRELNNMSLTDNKRNILLAEEAKIETYITFMKTAKSLINGTGSQVETNYIALVEMMKRFTFFKLSNTKNLNIRNWIKDDPRSLMVSVPLATKSSSMSVASAFFEVLGRELLSIGENFGIDPDREIHLIIDEFTNISKINIIIELLTLVRKYQVSVVLTYQEVSRIQLAFSREELEAFENNIATKVFFQATGEETIRNISSKVGKQDLEFSTISNNMGVENNKDGANLNRQIQEKTVITDAEIMALKPFQFLYVRKGTSLVNDENKTIFITAKIQSCLDTRTFKEKREDMYSDIKSELQILNIDSVITIIKSEDEKRKAMLLDKAENTKQVKQQIKEVQQVEKVETKEEVVATKEETKEETKEKTEDKIQKEDTKSEENSDNLNTSNDFDLEENKPEDLNLECLYNEHKDYEIDTGFQAEESDNDTEDSFEDHIINENNKKKTN